MQFTNFTNFYLNAHTKNDTKKVVVCVSIDNIHVIMPTDIANREFAEYQTYKIHKVNAIFDKNGKSYNSAIDIYSNEPYSFNLGQSVISNEPIKIYMNYNTCVSKQVENRIKKLVIYDKNGNIIMDGMTINGVFTGKMYDQAQLYNYSYGKLVLQADAI